MNSVRVRLLADVQLLYPEVTWRAGLTGKELVSACLGTSNFCLYPTGIKPDGGVFFWQYPCGKTRPLLIAEMKNQGPDGNAIERWFKNYCVGMALDSDISYVTFCTGAGSVPNGIVCNIINNAFLLWAKSHPLENFRSWNRGYTFGPSCFRRSQGFSEDTIYRVLRGILLRKIGRMVP